MKLSWEKPEGVGHEMLWGGIGLVVLVVATCVPVDRLLREAGYECPFYKLTGVPCLTCRATRALVAVGRLDFGPAFRLNPLATALFLALVVYVLYAMVAVVCRTRRLRFVEVSRRDRTGAVALAVVLVLANWAYLVAATL